jgi:hypothetical protein
LSSTSLDVVDAGNPDADSNGSSSAKLEPAGDVDSLSNFEIEGSPTTSSPAARCQYYKPFFFVTDGRVNKLEGIKYVILGLPKI